MPLQGMQTNVQKVVQTYWGPCTNIEQVLSYIYTKEKPYPETRNEWKLETLAIPLQISYELISYRTRQGHPKTYLSISSSRYQSQKLKSKTNTEMNQLET